MRVFGFFGLLILIGSFISCSPIGDKKKSFVIPENAVEKVVETYSDGKTKVLEYYMDINGVETIYGFKELYPSGSTRIQGAFTSEKMRNGLWESFYEEGTKWSVGSYIDGIAEGPKKVWYENGKLRYSGQLKNGKPIGEWSFWDDSGEKTIKSYKK